jgi:hypothetical protein
MLKGWKTYLVAAIGVIVNGSIAMGYIPVEYLTTVNSILGFFGLAALRAGVAKK